MERDARGSNRATCLVKHDAEKVGGRRVVITSDRRSLEF
jgi:hypothetical protein